ncbi:uncharacterized protein EV422DRAFT_529784 [Fimicolochytrium jonesii]|uniref:uncharacterized protein n=1 Tax=Fimicolochytrium jonesii TaxID=1396493 RepID=UPI0022FF054A|nr:uncharacterized protein EV422DRAFT_529784 [Fimicolochytrium jonesii]KAI8820694.1 hypothetical protein EV422DRAFT_529784 [Fimicolochytrium jonesii]
MTTGCLSAMPREVNPPEADGLVLPSPTTHGELQLLDLPTEILMAAIRFLNGKQKSELRLISHHFETLFWSAPLWKTFDHDDKRSNSLNPVLRRRVLAHCGSTIRALRYSNLQHESLLQMVKGCGGLTEVALRDVKPDVLMDAVGGLSMAGAFIKLSRLDITMPCSRTSSYTPNTVESLLAFIGTSTPNLKELHFMVNGFITPMALKSLTNGCPNLESLSLSSCYLLNVTDFAILLDSPCAKNLRYLCLAQLRFGDDLLMEAIAATCTSLRVLLVHHAASLTDGGVRCLAERLKSLRWIKLQACRNISLGVLDRHGFVNDANCPVVYVPRWPVGFGMAYRRVPQEA